MDYRRVLNSHKDESVLGTYEPSAFLLSLRNKNEFSMLHPSGYHCIPHIGTYGEDYALALPMVLLSLPTTPSYLRNLPQDILNALDLAHYARVSEKSQPIQTPPNTPLVNTTPAWIKPPDAQLKTVARQLVWTALVNACNRVLSRDQHMDDIISGMATMSMDIRMQSESEHTSSMSIDLDSDSPASKKVSFSNLSVAPVGEVRSAVSLMDCTVEENEEEVRIVAKKLVNKALHLACKTVESLYRRSSIEYLIASTKRMKIAQSPSPPPPLYEETREDEHRPNPFDLGIGQRSPSPDYQWLQRGAKRQRSDSHDISTLGDINLKKHLSAFRSQSNGTESRRIIKGRSHGNRPSQLANIVTQMSIAEEDSTSTSEEEHSFSSDTKSRRIIKVRSRGNQSFQLPKQMPIAEEGDNFDSGEESSESDGKKQIQNKLTSVVSQMSIVEEGSGSTSDENLFALSPVDPRSSPDIVKASQAHEIAHLRSVRLRSPESQETQTTPQIPVHSGTTQLDSVPDMDFFAVVHSYPNPQVCQKFLCGRTNEMNLVYHCWLYRDSPFVNTITLNGRAEMGVFCPHGVEPAHLDLQDAGVPFHFMEERTVCIHNCCFSPENAQLQLVSTGSHPFHSFFSAARHGNRRVVAFHFLPGSEAVEESVRSVISSCCNLGELVDSLQSAFPEMAERLTQLVLPGC